MTNNQANTTINLLRDIFARLGQLMDSNSAGNTSIQQAINEVDTDLIDFASLIDNWYLIFTDKIWLITAVLFFIFTLIAINTFRDR